MEITITPEIEKLIDEEMQTGDYISPTDVLVRSSRIPKKERLENLRSEIQKGIDAIRNGNYKTYDANELDDFIEEVIENGKKRLAERNGEK